MCTPTSPAAQAENLPVDRYGAACRLLPGEGSRAVAPGGRQAIALRERASDGIGKVRRLREERRVAGDLLHGGVRRSHHWRTARHRLEDRQPEPFVPGRPNEAGGLAVQADELVLRDVSPQVRPAPPQL